MRRKAFLFVVTYRVRGNVDPMPRKVRELVEDLEKAGFHEIKGGGKGSHRKFAHPKYPGAVTVSGQSGDDVKPYQEKQVKRAIELIDETK